MRRAFTLPELMLSLAVASILMGIALPRLARAVDRLAVQSATAQVLAAHQRARVLAISRSQVLTLSVDSDLFSISPRGGGALLWSELGPAAKGVALDGPTRRFTFAPEGITLGLSNASLRLSRGSISRTLVVSRLGRIRVLR
jgi:prepilin-type N-terminal cleavage/methylation domain-containing protein